MNRIFAMLKDEKYTGVEDVSLTAIGRTMIRRVNTAVSGQSLISWVIPAVLFLCAGAAHNTRAEKVLIYDENKGIIFVDKDQAGAPTGVKSPSQASSVEAPTTTQTVPQPSAGTSRSRHDLHPNRKKDPPQLYFESGLQYYQTGDFENALKNFRFASERAPRKPEYLLWIAKTFRQMEQNDEMLAVLADLARNYPESDVADDALFEIAFYYQQSNHYDSATIVYARLAEQYPFGASFAGEESFLEISRDQRRRMRAEMMSTLKLLGYEGETLQDMYAAFQKGNNLQPDGRGNRQTVEAIKERHRRILQEDEQRATQAAEADKRRKQQLILIGVAVAALLATVGTRGAVRRTQRRLDGLFSQLADLDTKAL